MEVLALKLKKYRIRPEEFEKIKKILGREPQGLEWALFSALWSEHCSYKSSKVFLKKFKSSDSRILTEEGENAGVFDLGEGESIAFKMESHNHPSFIEPFHGAATGVGGILRDIFTMGARPIMLANYLCFGESTSPRMKSLLKGVVKGISYYGNCVGVPTMTGATHSHPDYNQNILVNAFALGLFENNQKMVSAKAKGIGNLVVYVGAKTGADGVHGASMASESFDENIESKKPTIQIGDAFYEKLLIEACLEALNKNLVVAMQDMGAAGLTSSSFEMAARGEVGFHLDLSKIPLRDDRVGPEEILLSESQERMLLVCEPKNFNELKKIYDKWGLEFSIIGEVVSGRNIQLKWKGEVVLEIDPTLIVDQAPQYQRDHEKLEVKELKILKTLLEQKKDQWMKPHWIYQQYDQRVGLRSQQTAGHPVAIIKLKSNRSLGVALGARPWLLRHDPKLGAYDAVLEPCLKLVAQGFVPQAMTDCLNFGNPEKKNVMSEFVASVNAISECSQIWQAPVISGNVSFYNETDNKNICPTPAVGVVGLKSKSNFVIQDHFTKASLQVGVIHFQKLDQPFSPQDIYKKALHYLSVCENVNSARLVTEKGIEYALYEMRQGGFYCDLTDPIQEGLYRMLVAAEDGFWKKLNLEFELIGFTKKLDQENKYQPQIAAKNFNQHWDLEC